VICDFCSTEDSDAFASLGNEDGDELTLCADCWELAFPGMREEMRHDCPICREGVHNFN